MPKQVQCICDKGQRRHALSTDNSIEQQAAKVVYDSHCLNEYNHSK